MKALAIITNMNREKQVQQQIQETSRIKCQNVLARQIPEIINITKPLVLRCICWQSLFFLEKILVKPVIKSYYGYIYAQRSYEAACGYVFFILQRGISCGYFLVQENDSKPVTWRYLLQRGDCYALCYWH